MKIRVSGKIFDLASSDQPWTLESRPGGWVIATHGQQRIRFMEKSFRAGSQSRIGFQIEGKLYSGEILAEIKFRGGGGPSPQSDFSAQFPGKVRKVLVESGAEVAEGDSLILIEAMKMEFAIKAPEKGKVVKVLVKEGQQLSPGDQLLEWKSEKSDAT